MERLDPVAGKKTGAYRQIENAFPPPVAAAVGAAIHAALAFDGEYESLPAHAQLSIERLQNARTTRPDLKQLLTPVRRATIDDQLEVLKWLEGKYESVRKKAER